MAAGSTSGGGGEGIKAGRAYVEVTTQDAGLKAGLNAAKKAVLGAAKEFAAAGAGLGGLGAAIKAPILESLREVVEKFSAIGAASKRTGASTEAISDLGYAAEQSHTSLEAVEKSLKFLDKTMAQAGKGSESAQEALAAFGLSVEDLKGKDADQKLLAISRGLKSMDEAARGPALQSILGRGGRSLLPMLENSREFQRLLKENGELGGRVSREDAENAETIEKAWKSTTAALKNAFHAIGAAILPQADTISDYAHRFSSGVADVKRFIDENRAVVLTVAAVGGALIAAGAALGGIGGGLAAATVAVKGLAAGVGVLGSALGLIVSPVGLIAAGLVGATAALLEFTKAATGTGGISGVLKDLGGTFSETFGGAKDALDAGEWELAFETVVTGLKVVWKSFLDSIRKSIRALFAGLEKEWQTLQADSALVAGRNPGEERWYDPAIAFYKAAKDELGGESYSDIGALQKDASGKTVLSPEAAALDARVKAHAAAVAEADKKYAEAIAEITKANPELEALKNRLKELREEAAKAKFVRRVLPKLLGIAFPSSIDDQKAAAAEALGNVRGQVGGYGASWSLGVGAGKSVAEQQLEVQKQIEANTREGGGLDGV